MARRFKTPVLIATIALFGWLAMNVQLVQAEPTTPLKSVKPADAERLRAFWSPILRRPDVMTVKGDPTKTLGATWLAALGERLFFDSRLSGGQSIACATCHQPALGFADGQALRTGLRGRRLAHTVPSLWGVGGAKALNWDGAVATLEEHTDQPLTDPDEMAANWDDVLARLRADPAIRITLPDGMELTAQTVRAALASYQRRLDAPRTRFDRWIEGERTALSPEEQAGFALFVGKASCISCHNGPRFSDDRLHDIGLQEQSSGALKLVAGGAKKTPHLRGISKTGPYMHDGRFETLEETLAHYGRRGLRIGLQHHARTRPAVVTLSESEQFALRAFLETL
ncbi:MAG: cytochrome c peroxidase [Pseudomonadota bacterium]